MFNFNYLCNLPHDITAKLKFYKEDGRWYADVPNHTQEENEMICGSDILLDRIANGRTELEIRFVNDPRIARAVLVKSNHTDEGATYIVFSHDWELSRAKCWICDVTHDVLGEHPKLIMIDYDFENYN